MKKDFLAIGMKEKMQKVFENDRSKIQSGPFSIANISDAAVKKRHCFKILRNSFLWLAKSFNLSKNLVFL